MKNWLKSLLAATAVTAFAVPAAQAQAASITLDLTDADSIDEFGDPDNVSGSFAIGANAHVTGVTYDLTFLADAPSWLSEGTIFFGDSTLTNGVFLTPGVGDDFPGEADYAGSGDLVALGLDFNVGADGLLYVELFESFDDFPDEWDGYYVSGFVTIDYEAVAVPEPATWAMMIAGFGLVGGAARRRVTKVTYA